MLNTSVLSYYVTNYILSIKGCGQIYAKPVLILCFKISLFTFYVEYIEKDFQMYKQINKLQ